MGELHSDYGFTATTDPIPTYEQRDSGNFADVDMGSYAVTSGELFSTGAVDCTMLAAVGERLSLLGHFVDFGVEDKGDNPAFLAAISTLHIIKPGLIVVAGGNASIDRNAAVIRRDRAFAEHKIAEYNEQSQQKPRTITQWNSGENYYLIDMFVSNTSKQILCRQE